METRGGAARCSKLHRHIWAHVVTQFSDTLDLRDVSKCPIPSQQALAEIPASTDSRERSLGVFVDDAPPLDIYLAHVIWRREIKDARQFVLRGIKNAKASEV